MKVVEATQSKAKKSIVLVLFYSNIPPFTSDSLHPQPAWQRAAAVFSVAGGRRRRRRMVVVKAVVVARWPGIALRRGVSTEL